LTKKDEFKTKHLTSNRKKASQLDFILRNSTKTWTKNKI